MSAKKMRERRRALRERPEVEQNCDFILGAAKRILAVDIQIFPVDRVTQSILGWLRAIFDQSRAIATLTKVGLAAETSPNRRTVYETVVRLQWLHSMQQEDRAEAIDAMLENERNLTEKSYRHMSNMGIELEPDLSHMQAVILNVNSKKLREQARNFVATATSVGWQSGGLYKAWHAETQFAHATVTMAVSYAPVKGGTGFPPVHDENLRMHLYMLWLAFFLAYQLLVQEGIPEDDAEAIVDAFLGQNAE